jgi:hypothetical protein
VTTKTATTIMSTAILTPAEMAVILNVVGARCGQETCNLEFDEMKFETESHLWRETDLIWSEHMENVYSSAL